jgi:hypothetical protein
MIAQFKLNRILWLIAALLTMWAAITGLIQPDLYENLVPPAIIPGVFAQDVLSTTFALILIWIAAAGRPDHLRRRIIAAGILGFFFYAYGIYAIERIYTQLYPVYLAIFGLSLFALIYALASILRDLAQKITVGPVTRYVSAGYGIFIAVMFNFIWFSQLIPLIETGNRIDYLYSIYIIDLCFIMPAFVISAVMAIRNKALGLIGLPALFILGFGILSPLALAEWLKPPLYGLESDMLSLWLFLFLSLSFLFLTLVYLINFRNIQAPD